MEFRNIDYLEFQTLNADLILDLAFDPFIALSEERRKSIFL